MMFLFQPCVLLLCLVAIQAILGPVTSAVLGCIVLPWLILSFPLILIYCFLVRRACLPTTRDMRRLEGESKCK